MYADKLDVSRAERYVALKILQADLSENSHELKIHQLLAKAGGQRASDRIVQLLDHFNHTGPNGTHLCLVFEPLGMNVWEMKECIGLIPDMQKYGMEASFKYPVPIGKVILRQILEALDVLHQNGIAHGDLGAPNMMFAPEDFGYPPEREIRQVVWKGRQVNPVYRKDGKIDKWAPRYQVEDEPLTESEYVDLSFKIKLSDMGAG